MIELRCDNNLYGRLTDGRWLEVKCKRRACGHRAGTVVLHTIDITTGKVVRTKRFQDPKIQKEGQHAADNSPATIRAS